MNWIFITVEIGFEADISYYLFHIFSFRYNIHKLTDVNKYYNGNNTMKNDQTKKEITST